MSNVWRGISGGGEFFRFFGAPRPKNQSGRPLDRGTGTLPLHGAIWLSLIMIGPDQGTKRIPYFVVDGLPDHNILYLARESIVENHIATSRRPRAG